MKVIAINSSPRKDRSNTSIILKPFLEGMKDAGAELELFYTDELDINCCQACFNCWMKTPGKCIQQDDMEALLSKLANAEIWVIATPVYVDGMTGSMKNLIDRLIPLMEPYMKIDDGHCRHPIREGIKRGKVVLVSTCGFWELDNFDALVSHVKTISLNFEREFAGAVLRPYGSILKTKAHQGEPLNDILNAARDAGRQLIQTGKISDETLNDISREVIGQQEYVEMFNKKIQKTLE